MTLTAKTPIFSGTAQLVGGDEWNETINHPLSCDYYVYLDTTDSNKIKAKNGKTGTIEFTHATNANTVLQSCLDALTAGGTIVVGVGTFDIFTLVSTANSVNIVGSGRGKTIIKRKIATNTPTLRLTGANSTIRSLTIDGDYPTNSSSTTNGELETNASYIWVHDVEIKKFAQDGIVQGGYAVISECIITGPTPGTDVTKGRFGILPYPLTTPPVTWIEKCRIEYCSLNAVYGSNITIMKDCYFANNAYAAGGQVGSSSDSEMVKVMDCVFERGLLNDSGVECQWGDWIVTGNHIHNVHVYGILVHNTTPITRSVIISNNLIRNCDYVGIEIVEPVSYFQITNNIVYDDRITPVMQVAIQVEAGAFNHYIVKNNICYGATAYQIGDLGSGTDKIIADNIGATLNSAYTDVTQTLTNKTVNLTNNTVNDTSIATGDLAKSNGTKFVRFARGAANTYLAVNAGGTDLTWVTPPGGTGNVNTGTANTYGDFDQLFRYGRIKSRNSADTFDHAIQSLSTAARTFSLPDISDTAVVLTATQTLTNKTVNLTNNTVTDTSTALGDLIKSDGTKFLRLARGSANQFLAVNAGGTDIAWVAAPSGSGNVNTTTANTYDDFDQIFRYGRIKTRNSANTFDHAIQSLSTAARTWSLPDVSDTATGLAATQTLTNKTVNLANNTVTDTSTAAGDIPVSNGTKFVRRGIGTAGQVPIVNGGATDWAWATLTTGAGDVLTTASNTYGDFDQLFRYGRLKTRNSGNTFDHAFQSLATATRSWSLPDTSDTAVGLAATQTLTNKTVSLTDNTVTATSTAAGDIPVSNGTKFVRRAIGTASQVPVVNAGGTDWAWASVPPGEFDHQFVIRKNGANYEAVNAVSGTVDSTSSTDASIPINYALGILDSAGTGGNILIKRGTYDCKTVINLVENTVQGLGIVGEGKSTLLDFTPAGAITNAVVVKMTHGYLEKLYIRVNSNVTNAIKLDGTTNDGTGGHMSHILLHGPNADTTGTPIAGQIGISQANVSATYWWAFHDIKIRCFDTGYISTASGGGSTSSEWTSSKFQNCNIGMDINGTQHTGTNLYFQGTSSVGQYGIRLRGTAFCCMFTNVIAELNKTSTSCACVRLDSGANHNAISNFYNAQNNGTTFVSLDDGSGTANNVFTGKPPL